MGSSPKGSFGGVAPGAAPNNKNGPERKADSKLPAAVAFFVMCGLLVEIALNVDSFNAVDGCFRPGDCHHLREVVRGSLAETNLAIAPRVVFFRHQQINLPLLSHKAYRLTVREALLAAGGMFIAVFAELQIAGEIQNL